MNKIIKINPEMFKISSSGTRKKSLSSGLKVRSEKNAYSMTNKNKLLKFIRRQEGNNSKKAEDEMNVNVDVPILSSEFDKSLQYLMDMQEKENKKEKEKEKEKENEKEKEEMIKSENTLRVLEKVDNPSYGCMKVGGTLPTYRQYHRHTQKNVANIGDICVVLSVMDAISRWDRLICDERRGMYSHK